jgi:signal transduction histidine kinase
VDKLITDQISVNCLTESKDGNIWLGTLEGIIRYNPETKTAEKFSAANGLVGDGVQSILQDDTGVLWISTTNGISRFDLEQKIFTSFTHFDGLQGNNFNRNSSLKAANGILFFGGANGWNAFNPATIKKQDERSPLVFTRFFINGVPVAYNTPDSPIEAEINSGKVIHLDHDRNNFGVMFALLEYNFASLANYSYKLEGLNDSWIDIGKARITAFTNLDPGTYTFRLKASNKDGYWHESDKPLTVVIHPAWWQTMWFKASIIFLLGGVIYGGFKLRLSQLTVQRNRLGKLVEERTASLASVNAVLAEKNNEIQAQNEELFSQNEHIITQREELLVAKKKLEEVNKDLEGLVVKRTAHLNEVINKLDHSVKTLDRFVYSASHDLSAPMKTIRGLLHVAAMENDKANTLEYFNLIKGSIKRFEDVILSMSNFSRNAHHDVTIEPVNISSRVCQIFDDMKYWPEAERITFSNEIMPDTIIYADRYRLETILQNLIGNSIKYADKDKDSPYVRVRCVLQPDGWLLEVADNGIGIKKGFEDKIFDMFFKASENSKGSGLGLFIVNEAVDKLKGTISVESAHGEGTTFKIMLPAS